MRKNLLRNIAQDYDFKDELECSSIRINAQDQNEVLETETRTGARNARDPRPQGKRYEENSLNGFEQSLSISGNQENLLELMRSKSAGNWRAKDSRQANPQKPRPVPEHFNSLYNTSSFDEMTMKMSISKTNHNNSHLHNITTLTDQDHPPTKLHRPQPMHNYKLTCADHEMKIMISEIHRPQPTPPSTTTTLPPPRDPQEHQTEQQREQRLRRVNDFIKNQSLLGSLKCSNVESEHSQNFEESSFQQPYFKAAVNTSQFISKEAKVDQPAVSTRQQQPFRKPHLDIPKHPKTTPSQPPKTHTKKLTLRDYIHLNQLSSKPINQPSPRPSEPSSRFTTQLSSRSKDKDASSHNSQLSSLNPRQNGSRKKKAVPSSSEVLARIKDEIASDLKLMQSNISILSEYFRRESSGGSLEEVEHSQIMRVYTISRMIKQKMLLGNDEIVKYLKETTHP